MSENSIKSVMDSTMENLRTMVDSDTIIGTPIVLEKLTLIPVSKVSFGLATGGGDFPSKTANKVFGGGGGAGVTISPVAFIAVNDGNVQMLPVYNDLSTVNKALDLAPEMIDKIKTVFSKNKKSEKE